MNKPEFITIPREEFETCGFRCITVAHGSVFFSEDGTQSSYSVRLMAEPGSDGDIWLIVTDLLSNEDTPDKIIKLKRKHL